MITFLKEFIGNDFIDYEKLSADIITRLNEMDTTVREECLNEGWMLNDILNDVMPGIVVADLKLNMCWNEYIEKGDCVQKFKEAYLAEVKEDSSDLLRDSCCVS